MSSVAQVLRKTPAFQALSEGGVFGRLLGMPSPTTPRRKTSPSTSSLSPTAGRLAEVWRRFAKAIGLSWARRIDPWHFQRSAGEHGLRVAVAREVSFMEGSRSGLPSDRMRVSDSVVMPSGDRVAWLVDDVLDRELSFTITSDVGLVCKVMMSLQEEDVIISVSQGRQAPMEERHLELLLGIALSWTGLLPARKIATMLGVAAKLTRR